MRRSATILVAFLGMSGGAWAQSLLDQTPQGTAPGSGPYDPPRSRPFKKHDLIQILVQERTRAPGAVDPRPLDVTFAITAEVADVRPNGTLVLQAMRRRKVNEEEEVIKLTAEVGPQSITGNKVASDKLLNLNLVCEGRGWGATPETAGLSRKPEPKRRAQSLP